MIPIAYKDGFDVDFAKTTIATLCNIIEQVHKRGIVHRQISAEVVGMKLSSSASKALGKQFFKVEILGGLGQIFSCLTSSQSEIENVIESNSPPTAPEVLAGELYSIASDVWQLGQLAY